MPHFVFTFEPSQAGCVERVCLYTPWAQPARGQQGQVMSPSDQAWSWLLQFSQQRDAYGNSILPMAQGCKIGCTCTNPGGQGPTPNIYCVQKAEPAVGRAQTNAPYNAPIGSGRELTMPPMATKERVVQQGMYEDLTDCALAANADSVFGEMDGAGGTFSDLDSRGNEVMRQIATPYSQKVTGGR